jgi:hypothetical protein
MERVLSQMHDKAGRSGPVKKPQGTVPCCMAFWASAAAGVWRDWRGEGACLHGGEGGAVGQAME